MTVVLVHRLAQLVPAAISVEGAAMPGSGGKILASLRKNFCRRASSGQFFQFGEKPGRGYLALGGAEWKPPKTAVPPHPGPLPQGEGEPSVNKSNDPEFRQTLVG